MSLLKLVLLSLVGLEISGLPIELQGIKQNLIHGTEWGESVSRNASPPDNVDLTCIRSKALHFRFRENTLKILRTPQWRYSPDKFSNLKGSSLFSDAYSNGGVGQDDNRVLLFPSHYFVPPHYPVLAMEPGIDETGSVNEFSDVSLDESKGGTAPLLDLDAVCWAGETVFNLAALQAYELDFSNRMIIYNHRDQVIQVKPVRRRSVNSFSKRIDASVLATGVLGKVRVDETGGVTSEDGSKVGSYTETLLLVVEKIYTSGWPVFGLILYSPPLLHYLQLFRQIFQKMVKGLQMTLNILAVTDYFSLLDDPLATEFVETQSNGDVMYESSVPDLKNTLELLPEGLGNLHRDWAEGVFSDYSRREPDHPIPKEIKDAYIKYVSKENTASVKEFAALIGDFLETKTSLFSDPTVQELIKESTGVKLERSRGEHAAIGVCQLGDLVTYFALARLFPELRVVSDLLPPKPFLQILERVLSCLVKEEYVPREVVTRFKEQFVEGGGDVDKAFGFFSLLPNDDPYVEKEDTSRLNLEEVLSPEPATEDDPLFAKPLFTRNNTVWFLLFFLLHEFQLLFYSYSVCPRDEESGELTSHGVLTRGYEKPYLSCLSDRTVLTEIQNGGFRSRGFLQGFSHFKPILEEHNGQCNAILDIGANVGGYSVFLARDLGYTVIAVEPLPENVRNLKATVLANGLDGKVIVVQAAISEDTGDGKMFLYERPEETGQSALMTSEQAENSREVDYLQSILNDSEVSPSQVRKRWEVDLVTVDELLSRPDFSHLRICLIKIDAEGRAHSILKSAAITLQNHRPAIVVELDSAVARAIHPPLVKNYELGTTSETPDSRSSSLGGAVVDFLQESGYKDFRSFEDFASFGTDQPDYSDYAASWQVQLLKDLRFGVWTAIYYKNALWDPKFSERLVDLKLGGLSGWESEPVGQLEVEVVGINHASFINITNGANMESMFSLDNADLARVFHYFRGIDRAYVVCAQICTANLLFGCRGFDVATVSVEEDQGTICRLFRSCAGFQWMEGENQNPFDSQGRPRVPEMGVLGAWGGDRHVRTQYRAMELDNDLVAFPR